MSGTKVKVCGLRRVADAAACVRAGVEYAGLNRVSGARRAVDLQVCGELLAELGDVQPVLVYRDAGYAEIMSDLESLSGIARRPPMVQLHGSEPLAVATALRQAGVRTIRALPGDTDPAAVTTWLSAADAVLLDGRQPGSGADWAWRLPAHLDRRRLWLAGGLTPDNVARALQLAAAAVVDAASGLETDGALDGAKILNFVAQVRGHAAMLGVA